MSDLTTTLTTTPQLRIIPVIFLVVDGEEVLAPYQRTVDREECEECEGEGEVGCTCACGDDHHKTCPVCDGSGFADGQAPPSPVRETDKRVTRYAIVASNLNIKARIVYDQETSAKVALRVLNELGSEFITRSWQRALERRGWAA